MVVESGLPSSVDDQGRLPELIKTVEKWVVPQVLNWVHKCFDPFIESHTRVALQWLSDLEMYIASTSIQWKASPNNNSS